MNQIKDATKRHNQFLKEFGLPLLPEETKAGRRS